MARAGFGGSGDMSGLFGSLYCANKQAQQAIQDATDKDTQDKWDHGLITDAEWMAYIATRISAETDPRRKESWITAQREYAPAIADKQAEFAYSNGGTINDLIAHYQARLASLTPNSNEYRDVALKVNDLQDSRSSEHLQAQADAMIAQINAGKKTYGDLRKLLQGARAQATPNSDYRKAVDKQLAQVKEQIRTNALEGSFEKLQYEYDSGKLSGGSYASKLRAMAGQFKSSDTKRYYQILEAATALSKAAGRAGGISANKARIAHNKKVALSIDSLQARRNSLLEASKAYENGATSFVNDAGVKVALTPHYMASVDHKLVSTLDQLATAYLLKNPPDKSAAANQKKTKAIYISSNVVTHNTMAADVSSRHLIEATSAQVNDALDNPDPVAARAALANVAAQWEHYSTGLTNSAAHTGGLPAVDAGLVSTPGPKKGVMGQVDGNFVARSAAIAAAFRTITTPGVDDASAAAAMESIKALQGAGGGATAGGQQDSVATAILAGALQVNARVQGLETSTMDRVAVAGGWEWVMKSEISTMAPDPSNPSNMIMVKQMVPNGRTQSGNDLQVDGKSTNYVTILADINGKPAKVQAVAERVSAEGFDQLKSAAEIKLPDGSIIPKGASLTQAQMTALLKVHSISDWMNMGKVAAAPALQYWQVKMPSYTDGNGVAHPSETWSQDDGTKLWYKGSLPIRGVQRDANGYVKIGDNGEPLIDWKAYSSAGGVPAPYGGSDPRSAQSLLDMGGIDVSGVKGRDVNGNIVDEPQGALSGAYYTPSNPPNMSGKGDSWWNDDHQASKSSAMVEADRAQVLAQSTRNKDLFGDQNGNAPSGVNMLRSLATTHGINIDGMPDRPSPLAPKNVDPSTGFHVNLPPVSSGPSLNAAMSFGLNLVPTKKAAAPVVRLPATKTPSPKTAKPRNVDLQPDATPKPVPHDNPGATYRPTQKRTIL